METKDRFIRMPELLNRTGLISATIYRLENSGQFPSRRKLGANSVAGLESEISEWFYTRELVNGGCYE